MDFGAPPSSSSSSWTSSAPLHDRLATLSYHLPSFSSMRAVWVCCGVVSRCCHGEASRFPSLSLPLSAVLISLDKVADHSRRSMGDRAAFSLSFGGGDNLLHDDVGGKDELPGVWSLIQMCDSEGISRGHLEQLALSGIPSIEPTYPSAASPSTLWVSVVNTLLFPPTLNLVFVPGLLNHASVPKIPIQCALQCPLRMRAVQRGTLSASS